MNAQDDAGRIHERMHQEDGSDIVGDVYARPLLILSIPPASSDQFDFPSEMLALPLSSYNGAFHHPPETLVYLWAAAES